MTKETLQERMTTLSRYFARDKWKAESGFFQYPRGKKRTEAVAEALEIAFDPSEFAIKKELNIESLPSTLEEALSELEKDEMLKETLGAHISEKYITAKRDEWNQYCAQVSEWEINQYLNKF